ncbi:MAG: dipeptidyl carboxypeptidase II, partial [Thermomonas sp.]
MKYPIACALALAVSTALAGCVTAPANTSTTEAPMPADSFASNPFAAASPLPMHYPQFDKIGDADFVPAFDVGMSQQLREMEAIANNPAAPTFANTIAEMEKTGLVLDRATGVFFNLQGTYKNDTRDGIEREYAPKFSAHRDAIMLNPT